MTSISSRPSPFFQERNFPAHQQEKLSLATPDWQKDLLDESLVQAMHQKILANDNIKELEPLPEPLAQESNALPPDLEEDAWCHCPSSIPEAIHRFVEWRVPGETPDLIAKRGVMHYNCAVIIANTSIVTAIGVLAATIFGICNLFLGLSLIGINVLVHYKTIRHLSALAKNLDALILSLYKKLAPQAQNDTELAQNVARKMQPTTHCCLFSWYPLMPKTQAEFESVNFHLSKN